MQVVDLSGLFESNNYCYFKITYGKKNRRLLMGTILF